MAKKSPSGPRKANRSAGEQVEHFWTYDDLCRMTGMGRDAVYAHASRKNFDPDDLSSVIIWVSRHAHVSFKQQILDYALNR